ncbi:MAG: hypothetical protein ACREJM_00510, partial [Candidatus Saccharimonadales bacterium]
MGNSPNGGWSWITGPIVDPKTGVPTPQFQRWLALALAQAVNPDGTLTAPAVTQAQGTLPASVTTLQAQAANLSGTGLLLSAGAAGLTQDNIADGTTYARVKAVSVNQATTGSIASGAVNSSLTQTVNTYVPITTSGQIVSANFTPDGGEVVLTVEGAVA